MHPTSPVGLCVIMSAGGRSNIEHRSAVQDDPQRRRPDISRAKMYIGWQPQVSEITVTCTLLNRQKYPSCSSYKVLRHILYPVQIFL